MSHQVREMSNKNVSIKYFVLLVFVVGLLLVVILGVLWGLKVILGMIIASIVSLWIVVSFVLLGS